MQNVGIVTLILPKRKKKKRADLLFVQKQNLKLRVTPNIEVKYL